MSRFCGPQGKGAQRRIKQLKRRQAEERDDQLPRTSSRRRQHRLAVSLLEPKLSEASESVTT